MKVSIPPIKSQGIKTKLVPWIKSVLPKNFDAHWIEPFVGTGVVAFNIATKSALLCDTNPHLVNFYNSIKFEKITPWSVREFLVQEGTSLSEKGKDHYYYIRERFNEQKNPLDFLFLNRSGFNGMIRFNRKGEFNTPFCHKLNRFSKSYITKIVNQVSFVSSILSAKNFVFKTQSFEETIKEANNRNDLIYCDPPYISRHSDYFNGWDVSHEKKLYLLLKESKSTFVLSTWHHNQYRANKYIESLWGNFHVLTREHYYHIGGAEKNRNPMVEALVTNFPVAIKNNSTEIDLSQQLSLPEMVIV